MTHRPWFKVLINTALRRLQPKHARRKWLMRSCFEGGTLQGYDFGWVEHRYG